MVYPFVITDGKRRISDHKQQKDAPSEFSLFEDNQAPNKKRRKLNDTTLPRKSYKDTNMTMLTNFRDTKPNINFTRKSFGSKQTTPEKESRLLQQLYALSTPVIRKRSELTPEKRDHRAVTPHSILKSKSSLRGSVSPTPSRMSRMSEFEDKSVKSITFAFPDSSESSELDETLNVDDSAMDEDMQANQSVSSSDAFYSPENSFVIPGLPATGPTARPALRSRSNTPENLQAMEPESSRPTVNIFATPSKSDVLKPDTPVSSSKFFQFRQEYVQSKIETQEPLEVSNIVPEIVQKPEMSTAATKYFQFQQDYEPVQQLQAEIATFKPEATKDQEMPTDSQKFFNLQQEIVQSDEAEVAMPTTPGLCIPEIKISECGPNFGEESKQLPDSPESEPSPPFTPIGQKRIFKDVSDSSSCSDTSIMDESMMQRIAQVHQGPILRPDFGESSENSDESSSNSLNAIPDLRQKPVLGPEFDDEDENIMPEEDNNEHENLEYGQEEDSNNSSDNSEGAAKTPEGEFEYGDVNFDDSEGSDVADEDDDDESSSDDDQGDDMGAQDFPPAASNSSSDVIEILSSSEEDDNFQEVKNIKQEVSSPLPNISTITSPKTPSSNIKFTSRSEETSFTELKVVKQSFSAFSSVPTHFDTLTAKTDQADITVIEDSPVKTSEQNVFSLMYDDLDEPTDELNQGIDQDGSIAVQNDLEAPIVEFANPFINDEPKLQNVEKTPVRSFETQKIQEAFEIPDEIFEPVNITAEPSNILEKNILDETAEESFTSTSNEELNQAVILSAAPSIANLSTLSETDATSNDHNVLNVAISETIPEETTEQVQEMEKEIVEEPIEEEMIEMSTNIFEVAQIEETIVPVEKEITIIEEPVNLTIAEVQTEIQQPSPEKVQAKNDILITEPVEEIKETVETVRPSVETPEPIAGPSRAPTQRVLPAFTPIKTRSRVARAKSSEPSSLAAKPIVSEVIPTTEEIPARGRGVRAKSVPKSASSASIRMRRVSSDDPHNPKNLLKEKILEKIIESEEIKVLSRSSSMHSLHDELPSTPKKLTRKSISVASIASSGGSAMSSKSNKPRRQSTGTPEILTPRRLTRASSKDQLTPMQEEEKARKRVRTVSFSDDEDAKSEISGVSYYLKTF